VQYIDVRDLASWMVRMSEERRTGTYNATGPDYELRMGRLLEECEAVGGAGAEPVWVSEDFLEEKGVEPFTELPLWLPREYAALQAIDCGRAIEAGLTFRPLSKTIEDVLIGTAPRGRVESLLRASGPRGSRSCSGPGTVPPCRMRVAR
jgi:nucleoside-diphosphate-sugar epimerase